MAAQLNPRGTRPPADLQARVKRAVDRSSYFRVARQLDVGQVVVEKYYANVPLSDKTLARMKSAIEARLES